MQLERYRSLWGFTPSPSQNMATLKASGYDGLEVFLPAVADLPELQLHLAQHELKLITPVITRVGTDIHRVQEHLEVFERQLEQALALKPVLVNLQPGWDAWTEREADQFTAGVLERIQHLGIPVAFETHRGCITYTPWSTLRLIERFPELKLTLDLSHWVVVCERLLEDLKPLLERCFERCLHVHARVGFEQGPQVADPRAPEVATHLAAHERWWRAAWTAQRLQGYSISTLTPEYGPPPYQPVLPFTGVPTSDLNEVCDWMAARQLENFNRWQDSTTDDLPGTV
ncbi:sugar phosphate isomerase/epimerase family protein [Deinococcus ruber]|uniref:Xylose isomerase-like TIM barrel domain-containing protein n=1 Tax=Deinococcus ruber TaxID=1848197 RepID=A0A918KWD1_9DEIO|nr:TIM barrel protein [Deinococcus ruber]GGR37208.1 hypothetical protein GCM10008957_53400 [Deinococcus ruber]